MIMFPRIFIKTSKIVILAHFILIVLFLLLKENNRKSDLQHFYAVRGVEQRYGIGDCVRNVYHEMVPELDDQKSQFWHTHA